jgi:hypothetical protein
LTWDGGSVTHQNVFSLKRGKIAEHSDDETDAEAVKLILASRSRASEIPRVWS